MKDLRRKLRDCLRLSKPEVVTTPDGKTAVYFNDKETLDKLEALIEEDTKCDWCDCQCCTFGSHGDYKGFKLAGEIKAK